jgi:hypothetical protein
MPAYYGDDSDDGYDARGDYIIYNPKEPKFSNYGEPAQIGGRCSDILIWGDGTTVIVHTNVAEAISDFVL